MTRNNLKPVILCCFLGGSFYKKTVCGRHIRFSFLPSELFVMHPGFFGCFTITHHRTGHAVIADKDYGQCLQEATNTLRTALKKKPLQFWLKKNKRVFRKRYSNYGNYILIDPNKVYWEASNNRIEHLKNNHLGSISI